MDPSSRPPCREFELKEGSAAEERPARSGAEEVSEEERGRRGRCSRRRAAAGSRGMGRERMGRGVLKRLKKSDAWVHLLVVGIE